MKNKNPLYCLVLFLLALFGLVRTSKYYHILYPIPIREYNYPQPGNELNIIEVNKLIDSTSIGKLNETLYTLESSLPKSRFYNSHQGKEAAEYVTYFLQQLVDKYQIKSNYIVNVGQFKHEWSMGSPYLTISPNYVKKSNNDNDNDNKAIIIGCHIDSINFSGAEAPGVDDNMSAMSVAFVIIEGILQALHNGHFGQKIKNSIEFHFYSAEEFGSLGSIDLHRYRKTHEDKGEILAMLQLDMLGYTLASKEKTIESHIGLVTDYTTPSLLKFTESIIDIYCDIPYHHTKCGKVCSDHVAALMYNSPAIYALESQVDLANPFRHGPMDTIEKIDIEHMFQFVKLTFGWVLELAYSSEQQSSTFNFKFGLLDYGMLELMHDVKRFVWIGISWAGAVGCAYWMWLDWREIGLEGYEMVQEVHNEQGEVQMVDLNRHKKTTIGGNPIKGKKGRHRK
ncbi:putative aminopeptidase [Martiniozyma asiatica (nom. inval.)]|nr:putative aminopeptidase [Martiniozyma asiatica]